MVWYYEHSNEPSSSIKDSEFCDQLLWDSAPKSWLVYLNEPPGILYKYDRQKLLNEKLLCGQKVYLQFPSK